MGSPFLLYRSGHSPQPCKAKRGAPSFGAPKFESPQGSWGSRLWKKVRQSNQATKAQVLSYCSSWDSHPHRSISDSLGSQSGQMRLHNQPTNRSTNRPSTQPTDQPTGPETPLKGTQNHVKSFRTRPRRFLLLGVSLANVHLPRV